MAGTCQILMKSNSGINFTEFFYFLIEISREQFSWIEKIKEEGEQNIYLPVFNLIRIFSVLDDALKIHRGSTSIFFPIKSESKIPVV